MPDLRVPNPARMYDYWLGGKGNLAADREAAERVIAAFPGTRTLARANRRFLTRAVWYLAEHGVRQYIELGSGLPASPNVHEVARQVRPGARVVYVDNDPVVAAHYREMCGTDDGVAFAGHDIRHPQDILTDPQVTKLIDFSAPVAVLCVSVLHFVPDGTSPQETGKAGQMGPCESGPQEIVTAFRWRMAPGSYLVISHALTDGADAKVLSQIADVYDGATAPAVPRTGAAIRQLFTGLDLVEPGLTDVSLWRPDEPEEPTGIRFLAGAGRKPDNLPGLATSRGCPLLPGGWRRPGAWAVPAPPSRVSQVSPSAREARHY